MIKKLLSFILVSVFGLTLIACKTTTDTSSTTVATTNGTTSGSTDQVPPAFVGAVLGKLEGVEHLKGEEINLLEGVSARDNVVGSDVEVTVINYGGYEKDIPGDYTIVIQAEDAAGNKATVEKTVTVIDTLTRTLNAIVIGGKFAEYVLNDTEALTYTTSGTKFRSFDIVQVMTKEFFVTEYNEHKASHTNNASVPYFPNGIIVVVDNDMKPKLVRLAAGVVVEVSDAGVLKTTELTWTNGVDVTNGGGNFKGLVEQLDTLIPDGGYVIFSSNVADQKGRIFLIQNFFYSGFEAGALTVEQFDADYTQTSMELVEGYTETIAVPDKIAAPVININRHVLSWEAIANAKGYDIYVDGELKKENVTTTSLAMADLELPLTPVGEDGYAITVKAITKDMYMWSTSDLSNSLMYKKIEIQDLTAPVLTINGKTITWDLVNGAVSYDIFISYAGKSVKLGNTTEGTFDLTSYNDVYVGYNNVSVKAIGDDVHYDSPLSTAVQVFLGEVKSLTIGDYTVDVIETTAFNYFTRRNTDFSIDKTGFAAAPYLFLITDINNINNANFGLTPTESGGTVVLLNSEGKPKLINNILAKQTWKLGQGWVVDDTYAVNTQQITNIKGSIVEGDMLLIGKNANNLTAVKADQTSITVGARELLAYYYVKPWETFPTGPVAPNGWRAPMDQFIDPTNVIYTINSK
ncbi:MAG: hypothetical protein K0Q49_573 [Haloplasmataceae bacterium]|jgi:hypothetical protein|nr:hypothetical protein [Haloplasmataceae bacterium]